MNNFNYRYKEKVRRELVRFIKKPNVTIEDFCIRCNDYLIKHGYEPVRGTPYMEKDGTIKQLIRVSKWEEKTLRTRRRK